MTLVWLNEWFNPTRERDAAMTLFNQNGDVIAFHAGSSAVMVAAQARGKLAVAYHSDMRKVAPDAQIVAITHQWGQYYIRRAQAVLDGNWKNGRVWGGVREGKIKVDGFGSKVPAAVKQEVLVRQKRHSRAHVAPVPRRSSGAEQRG